MTKTIVASLLVASLALPALAASNKGGPPSKGAQGSDEAGAATAAALATFTELERRQIVQYYQDRPLSTKRLPPGIAKNLARGKPLPPGIAKKFLPEDLNATLPARPGYERIIVGSDVLLIDAATQVVADVLRGVLRR